MQIFPTRMCNVTAWRHSRLRAHWIMALVGGGGVVWGRSMYSAFPGNCSVSYLSYVYGRSLWAELNGGENSLHWKANMLPLSSIMTLWSKANYVDMNDLHRPCDGLFFLSHAPVSWLHGTHIISWQRMLRSLRLGIDGGKFYRGCNWSRLQTLRVLIGGQWPLTPFNTTAFVMRDTQNHNSLLKTTFRLIIIIASQVFHGQQIHRSLF